MKHKLKQKNLIAIIVILIAIVLVSFIMAIFKGLSTKVSQEIIETLIAENEDNPQSVKYLVTDNCISRVYPETEVKTFVTNFSDGEVVKVYTDKECTKQVTDGFVMSGMYAMFEENNRKFEISVLGDIDEKTSKIGNDDMVLSGDGVLNQIELTRDIREAVEDENWRITEDVERKSADVNCNGLVDKNAVKTIIDYIVFGNLNIDEVPIVKKPTIQVASGNLNVNTIYTSDVVLKINENEENAWRTLYKITGDKNQDYKVCLDDEEVVLDEDGTYKITAYTYGKLGNKSKREYAIITIDKTADYTMEYYFENVEGTFSKSEKETKTVEGIIGETVEFENKLYTDYVLDVDNVLGNLQGTVLEDGSLVLKAYYERKSYTYTFKAGENVEKVIAKHELLQPKEDTIVAITGKWGEKIAINSILKKQIGYEITWKNWVNTQNATDKIGNQETEIIIGKSNKEYECVGNKKIINYVINYELVKGKLSDGISNLEKYNIETESFTLNNPSRLGYIFEGWTGGVVDSNGNVIEDATSVITGNTGNVVTPNTSVIINSGSIGNRKYIANWKPIENTTYVVEHYKETLTSGKFELAETENLGGITDAEVSAKSKTYIGFTYNEDNPNTVKTGVVSADGKLVLKLYYTRNIYNLEITAGDNIASVSAEGIVAEKTSGEQLGDSSGEQSQKLQSTKKSTTTTLKIPYKYEQYIKIDAVLQNLPGYSYTWLQWNSSNLTIINNITDKNKEIIMPAANIQLTATADKVANIYTIEYDLNGGTLPQGVTNASTYTIETDNLSISNLKNGTKLGYNFAGWTGGVVNDNGKIITNPTTAQTGTTGNVTSPTQALIIQKGSIGNRKYIANWEEAIFEYKVEYYYDNVKDEDKTETHTAKYNSIVNTYTDKCITGYELKETPKSITISYNENENIIRVDYIRKSYKLTLQKDDNIDSIIGSGMYKYNESVQINATLKQILGYKITWNGWNSLTPGLIQNKINKSENIIMPAGDIILKATANKQAINYNIQYMLNGGTIDQGKENVSSYTIETSDITLNNPVKQGYVFAGWTGGTEEVNCGTTGNIAEPTENVTIRTGSMGDRVYTANWVGDSKTGYKVKYYKEKLDGTYELAETVNLEGTTDATVLAVKRTYQGFTFDENNENNILEGTVKADGSLVLNVYYKRNKYILNLVAGENIKSVSFTRPEEIDITSVSGILMDGTEFTNTIPSETKQIQAEFKFGSQVNISAVMENETGYTIIWNTWESNDSEILTNQPLQNALIGIPMQSITLTAKATKTPNVYGYKIEYYYDNEKDESKTEEKTAKFGTVISGYTNNNKMGYELEKIENKPIKITENEINNVMKVYYKQTVFGITYDLNEGTLPVGKTNLENYNVSTETFTLNNPEKAGYTFLGWTGGVVNNNGEVINNPTTSQTGASGNVTTSTQIVAIEKGSIGNRKYIANWRANTDTEYKVEHYKENLDGTFTKVELDTETLTGTTNEIVTGTPKTYKGFTYDENNKNAVKSGAVKGDGGLILKLYYTRNSYTLTLVVGDNIESVGINTSESSTTQLVKQIKYEQQVDISAILKTEEYYEIKWLKWESDNTSVLNNNNQNAKITMPAENVALTAKASKQGKNYKYTIEYYYNNEIDSSKTETKTARYNTTVDEFNKKDVLGFEFERVEGTPLKITQNEETNKIKVYYKILNYTIKYDLQDGKLPEGKTNIEQYNVKTEDILVNNPKKQGYNFLGWTGGVVNNNGEVINNPTTTQTGTTGNTTSENAQLIIERGSIGNRKYTANWRPCTDTNYKIEHYIEKLDSTEETEVNLKNYTLYKTQGEDGSITGTTGEIVTASPIEILGFTYNAEKSSKTISGTISPDGTLVLQIFYTRNTYKLNLVAGENIEKVINGEDSSVTSIEKTYKYEESVKIGVYLSKITGYTTNWKSWTSSNTELIPNLAMTNTTVKIPAGNVTLTANAKKEKAKFAFTVDYYYDNKKDETETEVREPVEYESVITSYTEKLKPGYEFERAENLPLTIGATEEENVIKVYYKLKEYTISYDLQDGNLIEGETNTTTYNLKTADIFVNNPIKDRYLFKGWTGGVVDDSGELITNPTEEQTGATGNIQTPTKNLKIGTGSIGNRKYTANWEERAYEVIVHHYLQGTGPKFSNLPVVLAEDEIFTTKTLGQNYETDDLIPTYDENGNIIETDERNYLDGKEFYVVENSGNTTGVYTTETIEVTYYYQYYPVVKIVSSPVESLNGSKYVTINEALQALENAGQTVENEVSKLEILRDVKDESIGIENKNIEIDLAGYYINSKSEILPTVKLDNSKCTVVDNSEIQTGKMVSENNTTIYIKTNSEFTLGVESKPVKRTPEIIGKTKGIEKEIIDNKQGVFNFFDGKITAKTAIDGNTGLTPILYSSTVTVDSDNNQVATLGVVSNVEARIGRKTYMYIEDAIKDANTIIGEDGSQVEITVVKDITKTERIVIDQNKNIKIDLNGKAITTTGSDYVFENNGKLEVVDSKSDDNSNFHIEAEDTNIVKGDVSNGKVVHTGNNYDYDFNFTFNSEEKKYELVVKGTYMNRDSDIFIDGIQIMNFKNSGISGNGYASVVIKLGELTEGEHTIRVYKSSTAFAPFIDCFDIYPAKGTITSTTHSTILNNTDGEFTLTSGNVKIESKGTSSAYKDAITNYGKVIINGGEVSGNKDYTNVIKNKESSLLTINGGNVVASEDGIQLSDNSKLIMTGGTCSGDDTIIDESAAETSIEITGGTVKGEPGIQVRTATNVVLENTNLVSTYDSYDCSAVYNKNENSVIQMNNCNISGYYGVCSYVGLDINNISDTQAYVINKCTFDCSHYTMYLGCSGSNKKSRNAIVNNSEINGGIHVTQGKIDINDTKIDVTKGIISTMGYEKTNAEINIKNCELIGQTEINQYSTANFENTNITNTSSAIVVNKGIANLDKGTTVTTTKGNPINNKIGSTVNVYVATLTSNSTDWGIYNEGTVNLGKNDDNIKTDSPTIIASNGIKNITGTLNFYDGKIKSDKECTIQGAVSSVSENTEVLINYEIEDGIQREIATVGIPQEPVAKIGENTYTTLENAIQAVSDDTENATTIELLKDIYPIKTITISENKNIKLDCKSFTIRSLFKDVLFENNGKLEIISDKDKDDTCTTTARIFTYANSSLINNKKDMSIGKLDLNYYVDGETYSNISKYQKAIINTGNLSINGTNISSGDYEYLSLISNEENGKLVVNGGNIKANSIWTTGIYNTSTRNDNDQAIIIESGDICADNGIYNVSTGNIIINDGTIKSNTSYTGRSIYNSNTSKVIINNGTIKNYSPLEFKDGELIINNGTVCSVIALYNSAYLEVNGGEIQSGRSSAITINDENSSAKIKGGIIKNYEYNTIENKGNLEIEAGVIENANNNAKYGTAIENSKTATISGGTITGYRGILNSGTLQVNKGNITGTGQNGISSSGTLTLGLKDGSVDITTPSIYGKTVGVYTGSSVFNFYDGIIEGAKTNSISGTISDLEEGYEPIRTINEETSRETVYLAILPIAENASTHKQYNFLDEAFEECVENSEEEIVILRNAIISGTKDSAVVGENKNIKLNLNGYELSAGNKNTITVKGKLTIQGSESEGLGTIVNTAQDLISLEGTGELIVNSGNLKQTHTENIIVNNGTGNITINGGKLTCYTGSAIINNGTDETSGNIIINGGTIESIVSGNSISSGTAINLNKGNVEVNNATITTKGNAIFVNNVNSEVIVNSGTIGINGYGVYNNVECKNIYINSGELGEIYNATSGKIVIGKIDKTIEAPKTKKITNNSTGEIIIENINVDKSIHTDVISNIGGGIVTFNDGYIMVNNYRYCAIYNINGIVNINGGTINATDTSGGHSGIENGYYGKGDTILNITGGNITGTRIAIKNGYDYGINSQYNIELNITGGTITSDKSDAIVNYGKLNIGTKDGNVNNTAISIKGAQYGIKNGNVFKYYDGIITGAQNKAIYGRIQDIENNVEILYEENTDDNGVITEKAELGSGDVAQIGENKYPTLAEAINIGNNTPEESDVTTIKLLRNVGIGGLEYNILDSKNIVLDLNGNRLYQYTGIINEGTYEVTDTSAEKSGVIDVSYKMLDNYGTFKLSNGKLYSNIITRGENSRILIYNGKNGNIKMTNGNIQSIVDIGDYSRGVYTIYNKSLNTIELLGGTIQLEGAYYGDDTTEMRMLENEATIVDDNIPTFIMDGTNINCTKSSGNRYIINDCTEMNIQIKSGKITGYYHNAIYKNSDTGKSNLIITGGEISGRIYSHNTDKIIIEGGILENVECSNINSAQIKNGTINGKLSVRYSDELIITGGTIIGDSEVIKGKTKIENGKLGNVHFQAVNAIITGGEITGTLYLDGSSGKSNVQMTGGKINNSSGNGVNIVSGTFTLGVKDYPVSTTAPTITATGYGVNNQSGTFNFYDGKIIGNTKAIYGNVNDKPDLYTTLFSENETVAILEVEATFEQVVKMNNAYYDSIQEAISAAGTSKSVITLEKDLVITSGITIGTNQDITIDLKGHLIEVPTSDYAIINNGKLIIIDTILPDETTVVESEIKSYLGAGIYNAGTGVLTIGIEDEDVNQEMPVIIGATYGIENHGTLSIFDGCVKGQTDYIGGIQTKINVPNGYTIQSVEETIGTTIFKCLKLVTK